MADLLSYALCSLSDVKESMGIDAGDTSKDNLIKRKINQATLMIESFCNLNRDHHFKETTYTNEQIDGNSTNQLILGMRPVTALTTFQSREGVESSASFDDVDSDNYFLDASAGVIDLLFNQSGYFNSYQVTYTAGYSTIPADLQEACVTLTQHLVENVSTGTAVKSKREGGRSIDYFDTSQSSKSLIESLGIDDMLMRYINYRLIH